MTNIAFHMPKNKSNAIKVIGVGGGGSNAVDHMYNQEINGVDFVICNTDAQALENSPIPNKIQLGLSLTEGMGAGANPEIGARAAQESFDELQELLNTNTKMVFITAGMGGGTGTGAAPIIAGIAKDLGLLTVGIVTLPFEFEGSKRMAEAMKGIKRLQENVDSLIVVNNNKLGEVYGELGYKSGFMKADEVLTTAAKGIAEVITHHYKQNIDLNDAKTVLQNSGSAIMGSYSAKGEDRAKRAIKGALDSPILNDNKITGAKNVLLLIVSGTKEVTLNEIGFINQHIRQEAGNDVNIILGVGDDDSIGEAVAVTIIATGFSSMQQEDISELETKKTVFNLEDEQTMEIDLFSSVNEDIYVRPNREETVKNDEKVYFSLEETETPEIRNDIEVSYEDLSISEEDELTFTTESEAASVLIPTTEVITNIEVDYDEIIAEILDNKVISEASMFADQTSLAFDFSNDEVEIEATPEVIKHNLEDFFTEPKEMLQVESPEEDLQLELKIADEVVAEIPPSIWESKKNTKKTSEEISPLHMSIAEFKKTTEERKMHLRKHNYSFSNNPSNIDDLEKEPAFKRMKIDIDDSVASQDTNASRTIIEFDEDNIPRLRDKNPFLDDNVD